MLQEIVRQHSSSCPQVNIGGLSEAFGHLCILNSNNIQQKDEPSFDVLAGIGARDVLYSKNEAGALQKLDDFIKNGSWHFLALSYDLKNDIEALTSKNPAIIEYPELCIFVPEFVFISKGNSVTLIYDEKYNSIKQANDLLDLILQESNSLPHNQEKHSVSTVEKDDYLRAANSILSEIQKGNIYELNYCIDFSVEKIDEPAYHIYHRLNSASPSPFSAFMKIERKYILSSSPERFLRKQEETIISQPMKGTIRRSKNAAEDEGLKKQLQEDKKERSENIMIVDLVRNDLSRIAERDSVCVRELCSIYSFAQVHQMVSTISCRLKKDTGIADILRATFPMGSMTGAPKIEAMKLIDKFERKRRGMYSGSLGYIDPVGNFDLNVLIRTIFYDEEKSVLSFSTGSAITALSDPQKEYEECILKAGAMLEILNAEIRN